MGCRWCLYRGMGGRAKGDHGAEISCLHQAGTLAQARICPEGSCL